MDKIRRGSDLRKEKWGSPSIQESKIAAMFSKQLSIHTVTNCVTFPRRPGSTTIPWCHMLLRSFLLENVCASMPCLLPSWSAMHDECVTCAKKCAVAMGANVLNWIASEDRLWSRAQTGEDCTELIGWQSENTCELSFHWLVRNSGNTSTCLWYKERGKRCWKSTTTRSAGFNWAKH